MEPCWPLSSRHGGVTDRPYHANGGKPAAVMSAAPWCPARGHYMEDVRVIFPNSPRCYRPRYLNIQRLNYLWTIRHSSAWIQAT